MTCFGPGRAMPDRLELLAQRTFSANGVADAVRVENKPDDFLIREIVLHVRGTWVDAATTPAATSVLWQEATFDSWLSSLIGTLDIQFDGLPQKIVDSMSLGNLRRNITDSMARWPFHGNAGWGTRLGEAVTVNGTNRHNVRADFVIPLTPVNHPELAHSYGVYVGDLGSGQISITWGDGSEADSAGSAITWSTTGTVTVDVMIRGYQTGIRGAETVKRLPICYKSVTNAGLSEQKIEVGGQLFGLSVQQGTAATASALDVSNNSGIDVRLDDGTWVFRQAVDRPMNHVSRWERAFEGVSPLNSLFSTGGNRGSLLNVPLFFLSPYMRLDEIPKTGSLTFTYGSNWSGTLRYHITYVPNRNDACGVLPGDSVGIIGKGDMGGLPPVPPELAPSLPRFDKSALAALASANAAPTAPLKLAG